MSKLGGRYLHPITFISDTYTRRDFHAKDFWEREQKTWGEVVFEHDHTSCPFGKEITSKILISKDGLIASVLPGEIKSDEKAAIFLSHHINSFLGQINLGGLFFFPVSEKEISPIILKGATLSQEGGCGDQYSQITLDRAIQRFRIPYLHNSPMIDFPWVMMRINKLSEIDTTLKLGQEIVCSEFFRKDLQILALEARKEYVLHKWNNALVLSWAFIEILINELWKEEIIKGVKVEEGERLARLKDHRTYSSAIKIEILYSKAVIDLDLYIKMNKLRKFRNDFIHESQHVDESDVNIFFEVVKRSIKIATGHEPLFGDPCWTRAGGWVEA